MRPTSLPLAMLALAGCVQTVGTGPDLGPCAEPPPGSSGGAWTYGEAGIGTCLAGPVDLRFLERGGRTWLLVSNADPYNNFTGGSLLAIDWDSVDTTRRFNRMSDLTAHAAATDRYLGEIGLVTDRPDGTILAVVPTRFSAESNTEFADDDLLVFDVTDPSDPVPWSEGARLTLRDDPYHVAVAGRRAFVLNRGDLSLSVVDTHDTPLDLVQVSGAARVGDPRFEDRDSSGSSATLAAWSIVDENLLTDDAWTLTWTDATWRVWTSTDEGLSRWQVASDTVVPAPTGPDVPASALPGRAVGPFAYLSEDGLPRLAFGADGNLRTATSTGAIADWRVDDDVLLRGAIGEGWDAWLDGPALFDRDGDIGLAFTGRASADAPGAIGVATSLDGITWSRGPEPVLDPADHGVIGFSDPSVRFDDFTGTWRMWLTVESAEGWSVAVSESPDGSSWSAPEPVDGLGPAAASPVITRTGGRYLGWFATDDGEGWTLTRADSDDGLTWSNVQRLRALPGDGTRPPRPAVLTAATSGFSVEARDEGRLPGLARDGSIYDAIGAAGLVFRVVTGHVLDGDSVDENLASRGLVPGPLLDEGAAMVATITGTDGRTRLARLDRAGDRWAPGVLDLLDLDALGLERVTDPVALQSGGTTTLWFATPDAEGRSVIRRATSTDGLAWTLADDVFDPELSWAPDGVRPGSLQVLGDGRVRLWFSADDRERVRIGSATSNDGITWTVEAGAGGQPWQLGPGQPGTLDDSGVRDPVWFQVDGQPHLAHSLFDGDTWRLGLATLADGADPEAPGPWVRRTDADGRTTPWLPTVARTFAAAGVEHPVVEVDGDGRLTVWFAGQDLEEGGVLRLGRAIGSPQALFPAVEHPTDGDALLFRTAAPSDGEGLIDLVQQVEAFTVDGSNGSSLVHDPERGFLYLTTVTRNEILVLDVRDDSTRGNLDDNVLDLEGLLRIRSANSSTGLFDTVPIPGTDLLYATGRRPEAVLALDLSAVVDDDRKQVHEDTPVYAHPLRTALDDAGTDSFSNHAAGAGMALRDRDGRRHLFVTHFLDNSVTVIDLDRGAYGEEVGYLPHLGENPHVVRVSPDGRHAVVANYLGDVEEGVISSTLAVIDADPTSPTFLQVLTTLVNR